MPLTKFQEAVARLLSGNRSEDSHLAGGAALHLQPNSKRYSNDLDYFQDSVERVATAFADDRSLLEEHGYSVEVELNQQGHIRASVKQDSETTSIEWAHDSAWRFLPPIKNDIVGYQLHPIDLAINKLLALAGRDEARDFLDILMIDSEVLPLGALCWAAVGKDPGFSPRSLLELLKRRGKYQPEDFKRLRLSEEVDLQDLKARWLEALARAESFIDSQDPTEIGCLFYDQSREQFVVPTPEQRTDEATVVPHFGRPGGVLPAIRVESD
jgi:hypothetical protein